MKRKTDKKGRRKTKGVKTGEKKSMATVDNRRRSSDYPEIFSPSPFTEDSRRKRINAQRRRQLVGWPLKLLGVIAVIAVIAALIALLPQFQIEDVTVRGTRHIEDKAVAALADHAKGEHFIHGIGGTPIRYLTLRYGNMEDLISEAFPLIREVKVQFRFPSEIRITVDEKIEVLAVRVAGGFALIDHELCVLRIANDMDFGLPVLEGVRTRKEAEQGQVLEIDDPVQLDVAINIMAAMIRHDMSDVSGLKLMEEVRQIRRISDRKIYLFIPLPQGGEIRVKLEDNRLLQERLNLLSYLIGEGGLKSRPAGELDMSGDTVYYRPDTT